tara:strand:+ start:405 stop:596 length:192 start_codon:yes stop_codon:yes gene_type:complete
MGNTCNVEDERMIYVKASRITPEEQKVLMEIYKKDIEASEKKILPLSIKTKLDPAWHDNLRFV